MAAIAATSPIGAYQREASRLASAVPRVGGKIVNREAGFNVGPFSVRYTATDYEFDLTGATAQTSFADTLDAAATMAQLAEMPALEATPPPNALSRRQALAGYAAAATLRTATPAMLSVRA